MGPRRWVPWTLAMVGGTLCPADALACAVCISLTKHDLGFLWSALFLMALPIALAGVIGGWLYYSYRRSGGSRHPATAVPHLTVTEKEVGH
ncbi:MAG: hypothetical protein HY725_14090 [Candidatus Rokubacteria bacterium]|nr:hypothetical protein [Candidatus Rokubacteria bacterium]